ncbi:hypothetical protein HY570_00480, partial [Candidatus Micrarchaeota archaeon]|nr:hypothetical protein [Candidatus Micrarchaeota archaeon]
SPNREFTYTSKNLKDLVIDLDTGVITSGFPIKSYPPNETKSNATNGDIGKPGLQPRIDRITEQISVKSGAKESIQLAVTNLGLDDGQFLLQVSCPSSIEPTYDPILIINSGETKSTTISIKGNTIATGECAVTVLDEKNTTSRDSKTFSYAIVKNCPEQCTGFSTQSQDPNVCSCVCDVNQLNLKCQADNLPANATSCACQQPQEPEPAKCLGIFLILFGLYAGMKITKL